jgi:hypothetical protein
LTGFLGLYFIFGFLVIRNVDAILISEGRDPYLGRAVYMNALTLALGRGAPESTYQLLRS